MAKTQQLASKKLVNKFIYLFTWISTLSLLMFLLIKLINPVFNHNNSLTLNFLTIFEDLNLDLTNRNTIGELIDWVANFNIIIILPINILMLSICIIFRLIRNKRSEDIKLLTYKEKPQIRLITHNSANTPIILGTKMTKSVEESVIFALKLENKYSDILVNHSNHENIENMSIHERTNLDGSTLITEPRHKLQKHANCLRTIAEISNIKLLKTNLRNITKKELIVYMKQVSELIAYNKIIIKGDLND